MSLITIVLLPFIAVVGVAVLASEIMARKAQPVPVAVKARIKAKHTQLGK